MILHPGRASNIPGQGVSCTMTEQEQRVVQPGDDGKNFSLKDQDDTTFDLLEHLGKRILLSFHPLAWTSFCADQMLSLEKNVEIFASLNTIAVGISVDSFLCKRAWPDHLSIENTRLLSDFWPHGAVAQAYGLFRWANGFSERANVIMDEAMTVRFVKVYPVHSVPDIDEVISFLKTN
jgi:peroxiredoxin